MLLWVNHSSGHRTGSKLPAAVARRPIDDGGTEPLLAGSNGVWKRCASASSVLCSTFCSHCTVDYLRDFCDAWALDCMTERN